MHRRQLRLRRRADAELVVRVTPLPDGFDVHLGGRHVIAHRHDRPFLQLGRGEARMDMHRGNFDIEDRIIERIGLAYAAVAPEADGWRIVLSAQPGAADATLRLHGNDATTTIGFAVTDPAWNRVWLDLVAEADEHVWGCGEQMSYFDLRGRRFPLWTSEPGVGRDKATAITQQADDAGRAGGDYYTTNYPQPTFLSSRRYAAHLDTTAYAAFDFCARDRHVLEAWAVPDRLELFAQADFVGLVRALSDRFGRPAPLPDWALAGAIIGLKDGADSFARLQRLQDAGVQVSALWCEDWAGVRQTSFGTRLFWDWAWNAERYPDLPGRIASLYAERGVRFLGYCNPYLCNDGALFPVAEAQGLLARTADGGTYLVDFGEFECGVLDFTNPAAAEWFGAEVIGRNMLGLGMSGWMADFGEYLPIDVRLSNGSDARLMHNAWPTLWARVNADAIAAAGRTGDALFFMRAGWTGTQAHCPLLWAGDQCVDFSRHDGLATVICAALSAGLLGNAAHHSDIGGYTSLFGLVRTAELLQRWAEMATFTPVMRTHEGNRPAENLQVDSDPAITAHFARMTRIHVHILPYVRTLMQEAALGLPAQRPLFLHFEADRRTYAVQDAYLYGPDLLVAPVHKAGATTKTTYLPAGAVWVHLWSATRHAGGQDVTVAAGIGEPPVFWREGSAFAALFSSLAALA